MFKSEPFDSYDRQCLDVCFGTVLDCNIYSYNALEEKSYYDTNIWVSSMMDVSMGTLLFLYMPLWVFRVVGWAKKMGGGDGERGWGKEGPRRG